MENSNKSGLGTAGFVLSIIAICTSFIPIINNISFVLGLLAIIFGIVSIIQKHNNGKVITAIILGILAIVLTLSSQKAFSDSLNNSIDEINKEIDKEVNNLNGNSTEEILAKYLDVKIGNFKVSKDEFFSNTELAVTLTNKSTEKKSFSIQIEAIDKNGNRLSSDYVIADSLNPNQSQDFKTFVLVESDKIEAFKNATFKIVEISMY